MTHPGFEGGRPQLQIHQVQYCETLTDRLLMNLLLVRFVLSSPVKTILPIIPCLTTLLLVLLFLFLLHRILPFTNTSSALEHHHSERNEKFESVLEMFEGDMSQRVQRVSASRTSMSTLR